MDKTAALILAESTRPRLLSADLSLCTVPVSFPCTPDRIEAVLTPERLAGMRENIEREGLIRGRLVYPFEGRRRVIDLDTGRVRWAEEGRPR
jgi:hypothetical protein